MKKLISICFAGLISLLPFAALADEAQTPLPEPAAPQTDKLENGRILVFIGGPRTADYQIGDSIPVKLVFILTPDALFKAENAKAPPVVSGLAPAAAATPAQGKLEPTRMLAVPQVQLEALKMGVLSSQASDAVMLTPAREKTYQRPDGTWMVVASFYVTTYVTTQKTQIGISAEYMYAVSAQPDGQPNWKSAVSPELPIGLTKAATDNQVKIINGDESDKQSPRARAALWLIMGSIPFALPMLGALLYMAWCRVSRQRLLSKNEQTWLVLDAVLAEARGRFEIEHYRRIFHAIREHFAVLGLDTTQTIAALAGRDSLDGEAVGIVFHQETLFFDPSKSIEPEQHERLLAAIAVLIPRR